MQRLRKETYWSRFTKKTPDGATIRDGLLFEDLVEELLKVMYPSNDWHRTGKSHDDNRDFYLITEDERIWAECKNYEERISLKVIAPTLIMAQVYEVDEILFFSYSSLNSGVRKKLAAFVERCKKDICVYDDGTLDTAIIAHMEALSPIFRPNETDIIDDSPRESTVSFYINHDPVFGVEDGTQAVEKYTDIKKIDYFSIIEADIYVDMPDDFGKDTTISILLLDCVENERFKCIMEDFDKSRQLRVKTNLQYAFFRIPMRVNYFEEYVTLPIFKVIIDQDGETILQKESPKHEVKLEWNDEVQLIGDEYRKTAEDFESRCTDNNHFSCFALSGSTGTGKTRLLKEMHECLLRHNYRIISFVGSNTEDFHFLLKELLLFLYDVPSIDVLELVEQTILEDDSKYQNSEYYHIYRLIQKLCICLDSPDDSQTIREASCLVLEKMRTKKCALIIDNLQKYGSDAIGFIQQLIEQTSVMQNVNKSILLFSYNTDYWESETIAYMCKRYLHRSDNAHYREAEVVGFQTANQVYIYLQSILKNLDSSFKPIWDVVAKKYKNPLFIKQLVKMLITKKIVKRTSDGIYTVPRLDLFYDMIRSIPDEISDILSQRFDTMFRLDHLDRRQTLSILSLISLNDDTRVVDIARFDLDEEVLKYLSGNGFISEDVCGRLRFSHESFERYAIEKFQETYYVIVDFAKNINEDIIACYPTLNALVGMRNFSFSVDERKSWIHNLRTQKQRGVIADFLFRETMLYMYKELQKNKISLEEWLDVILELSTKYRNDYGYRKSVSLFSFIDSQMQRIGYSELASYRLFRTFLDIYADTMRIVGNISQALSYLEKVENIIRDNSCNDEENALLSMICNRRLVVLRDLEDNDAYDEQIKLQYDKSRQYASKIQEPSLRAEMYYLNDSDIGYLYYTYHNNLERLIVLWDKCLQYPIELIPSKILNIYRKQAQLFLLKEKIDDAFSVANQIEHYLKNHPTERNTLVFTSFMRKLKAVCFLLGTQDKRIALAEEQINEAMKIDLQKNPLKMYDVFLLKGICYYYQGSLDNALSAFNESLELLSSVQNTLNKQAKIILVKENIAFIESKQNQGGFTHHPVIASGILRTKELELNLPLLV